MASGPTDADKRLARAISKRLKEKVTKYQVERLREHGLVTLDRPGRRSGLGGRMPGTYSRRMVTQGAKAIPLVRKLWNHDVAAAVMHLRGFDIAPSALRRLWLGTKKKPGPLIHFTESDPDPVATRVAGSASQPIRQMARILGSRERAQTFAGYAAYLLSGEGEVENDPPAVIAPFLEVEPWESLDVSESVVQHVTAARSVLRSLPEVVRGATKSDWDRARDAACARLELAILAQELRRLFPRGAAAVSLDPLGLLLSSFPHERMAIVLVPLSLAIKTTVDKELRQARAVLSLAKSIPARMRLGFDTALAAAQESGQFELDDEQMQWLSRFAERRPEVVAALPSR